MVFMDYLCDCKVDFYVIMEIWFMENDVVVRVELNLDGYNLLDYLWEGWCGGGMGFIYCDFLCVKEVEVGEKSFFEFLEWIVIMVSNCICLVIIY